MFATRAFLPIAEDYEVEIAAPVESGATSLPQLLDEIRARWNVEGGLNDYYHGVFLFPWPGSSETGRLRTAGIAATPGNVAVSTLSSPGTIAHEFGHNLSLRHPPGCGATNADSSYPYADGALGPVAGWDVNWRRFVSGDDAGYADVMSYCGLYEFISGYHYRIASSRRPRDFSVSGAPGVQSAAQGEGVGAQAGGAGPQGGGAGTLPGGTPELTPESDADGGLALSGRIDSSGQWSLTHTQGTDRGPRAPAPDGQFTLILLDGAGVELYREPLSVSLLSHSDEAGWAARTPVPASPVRQVVIVDAQGVEVLREELQGLE